MPSHQARIRTARTGVRRHPSVKYRARRRRREAVEMGENDGRLAGSLVRSGRHQFDGLRLKSGGPEQWIVRETAIPTVVRSFRAHSHPNARSGSDAENLFETRHCDEDTPRRDRKHEGLCMPVSRWRLPISSSHGVSSSRTCDTTPDPCVSTADQSANRGNSAICCSGNPNTCRCSGTWFCHGFREPGTARRASAMCSGMATTPIRDAGSAENWGTLKA
ncbi:hypothetical protein Mame_04532 (plasmid) [Martelella mediterranea DSM 17316]|uniref:Uncharacterized protein n=1 Tax=Martelella mediterranea DSM 17316 TaxID=1122214 RepID=A0A1U9Z820_9HYPH|nr:hypothetical protein Mame_04532 [Martelella mediterranea DSM 17316]